MATGYSLDTKERPFLGRDVLVERLWTFINSSDIVIIDSARRVGKTTLMKAMADSPPDGHTANWIDVQNVESPHEFFSQVFECCSSKLSWAARSALRAKKLVQLLSGLELGPIRMPNTSCLSWKSLMKQLVASLVTSEKNRILLFIDEIPLMLHKVLRLNSRAIVEGCLLRTRAM